MSDTTLNEKKAHLYETDHNGKRVFIVTISSLNVCFSNKYNAQRFKELYDSATKHISKLTKQH